MDQASDADYVCLFVLLLVYAIATVLQLYLGADMMYEMRRKPKPTLLQTQGIFNLPHHIGMVSEELAFDDVVRPVYTEGTSIAEK